MDKYGYIRVAACKPIVKLADPAANAQSIMDMLIELNGQHVKIAVFPELSISGYTCADLFFQSALLTASLHALESLRIFSSHVSTAFAVGAPIAVGTQLYNCAILIHNGQIKGITPKRFIPNYNEFYERRWFTPASDTPSFVTIEGQSIKFGSGETFDIHGVRIGMEICEDLWVPNPPSSRMAMAGADIILNLSATDELAGKHTYLLDLIRQQSARCRCGYVYSSCGSGESSTDLAFAGNCIIAENGTILAESHRFCLNSQYEVADIDVELLRNDRLKHNTFGSVVTYPVPDIENSHDWESDHTLYRKINPHPFVEENEDRLRERCEEISSIQAWGLAQRLKAIGCKNAVIGISGGLDSTLALLVTVRAFDMLGLERKGILGVTMPGFGTTARTRGNAWTLMEALGISTMEISINDAVELHFRDIDHNPEIKDATYENSQARERTQILMDLANQTGGIVIGTGDLSELALGWCTYNGDHMSMYGVNTSIPKTLVRDLVKGYMLSTDNEAVRTTLADIIDTPISPELLPAAADGTIAQKTEDTVGPYELHDFFLHAVLRYGFSPEKIFMLACKAFNKVYDRQTIKRWLSTFYRRFFSQQFKRSCMPDGIKVGSVCLSPRGDWRMPSDACVKLWMDQIDTIEA